MFEKRGNDMIEKEFRRIALAAGVAAESTAIAALG
jgi:hypothetical protein